MSSPVRRVTPFACECGNHFWAVASRGLVVMVSPVDAAWLELKWSVSVVRANRVRPYFFARRNAKRSADGRSTVSLHREILALKSEQIADHLNLNPLDNRRENLRICTPQQNAMNRPTPRGKAVPFKGVQKVHNSTKFKASIRIDGEVRQLGQFDTPEEAHEAYVRAARRIHGEFFRAA